jgi:hypothetical protein
MREPSRTEPARPDSANTEEIGVLRSPALGPALAETLPPSGLLGLIRPTAATEQLSQSPPAASTPTEPATTSFENLERLSALVDRAVRKSGPPPAAPIKAQLSQSPPAASTPTEPATAGLQQLEQLTALVDREVRKSGPISTTPATKSAPIPTVPLTKTAPAAPTAPAPAPAAQAPTAPAAAVPAAQSADDEEPLEAYLSRFMERLTGKQNEPAEPVSKTVPTPSVLPRKSSAPVETPKPAPVWPSDLLTAFPIGAASSSPPAKSTPLPPAPSPAPSPAPAPAPKPAVREPTKPPECRQALTAMREVANENARSAVAEHATLHISGQAKPVLVVATGTSLISSLLAAAAISLNSPACLWASVAVGSVAALAACRFFLLCRQFEATNDYLGDV